MFSLQRCREIVGPDSGLDDDQLVQVRDQMYAIADVVADVIGSVRPRPQSGGLRAAMTLIPGDEREAVEERAAIIEHDAGLPRDEAERQAVVSFIGRTRRDRGSA